MDNNRTVTKAMFTAHDEAERLGRPLRRRLPQGWILAVPGASWFIRDRRLARRYWRNLGRFGDFAPHGATPGVPLDLGDRL